MGINKRLKVLVIGALLTVTLASVVGCNSKPEENSGNETKQSEEAVKYKEVDGTETEKLIEETNGLLLVDVRTPDEYADGHIQNAINIPFDEFESKLGDLENYKDKTIVLYCRTGNRSGKAADILVKNGFKDVYNAADGVEEHEYKLVKHPDILGAEAEKFISENKDVLVIDARKEKDFKKGTIKGAINIELDNIDSKIADLEKYKDKDIILFCYSGNKSGKIADILTQKGFEKVTNVAEGVKEYNFNFSK